MTKHTPGPFIATVPPSSAFRARYIEAVREDAPNVVVAEVLDLPEEHGSIHAAVANAALFAAAPDLEAALINGACPCWVHNAALTTDIEALRKIALWYADWNNDVRLPAIAKAEGRTDG